jgi:hypothetical protein
VIPLWLIRCFSKPTGLMDFTVSAPRRVYKQRLAPRENLPNGEIISPRAPGPPATPIDQESSAMFARAYP